MPRRSSEQESPAELLMPVSDEHALRRFEIEALQRINDNLRLLNNGQAETVKALGDMREGIHRLDVRLVRIESNSVSAELEKLKLKVDDLTLDKASRTGTVKTFEWLSKVGPWLIALVLGLAAVAGWERVG